MTSAVCVCDQCCVCGVCREIRQEKEKMRVIRNGRNKFNAKPKDVCVFTSIL